MFAWLISSCPALPARVAARVGMSARWGAGGAVGDVREPVEVDIVGERLRARVDGEDRAAALLGREVDVQLGAEAARAPDRRVERVEPVGRGDADHAAIGVEAVELDEQLVERLLALVVAAVRAAAALLAERVELVEEDHGRLVAAGVGGQTPG